MIGEIAILIKGLDSAFSLVKAGIDRKKSIDEMSEEIGSFFKKKEAIEEKMADRSQSGQSEMSTIEEERAIEEHRFQVEKMMESIGREYSRQGRSPAWARIKRNSARKQREKEIAAAKRKKKKAAQNEEDQLIVFVIKVIFIMFGVVFAILGGLFLILGEI